MSKLLKARMNMGIWNSTNPKRFASIMDQGIHPEPVLAENERWKTEFGRENYPFVRFIGGGSLFDFSGLDSEEYSIVYPLSTWHTFVPDRMDWRRAVWIEVGTNSFVDLIVSTEKLMSKRKEGGHYRHTLMPHLECACIGPIPISAFKSAFMTWSGGERSEEIPLHQFSASDFLEDSARILESDTGEGL